MDGGEGASDTRREEESAREQTVIEHALSPWYFSEDSSRIAILTPFEKHFHGLNRQVLHLAIRHQAQEFRCFYDAVSRTALNGTDPLDEHYDLIEKVMGRFGDWSEVSWDQALEALLGEALLGEAMEEMALYHEGKVTARQCAKVMTERLSRFEIQRAGRLKLLDCKTLDEEQPEGDVLVEDLFETPGVAMLYGPPNVGKSITMLDFAHRIASDEPEAWERKILRHGRVVYICAEGFRDFQKRHRAWRVHYGCHQPLPFDVLPEPWHPLGHGAAAEQLIAAIDPVAQNRDAPVLIVMDTVFACSDGCDLNSSADARSFVQACRDVATHFNALFFLVHHPRKNSEGGFVEFGSVAFRAQLDFVLLIEKVPDPENLHIRLTCDKSRSFSTNFDHELIITTEALRDDGPKLPVVQKGEILSGKDSLSISELAICRFLTSDFTENPTDNPQSVVKLRRDLKDDYLTETGFGRASFERTLKRMAHQGYLTKPSGSKFALTERGWRYYQSLRF